MKKVNRAQLRGKNLDENCALAQTTTHEYGPKDNRIYCHGLVDLRCDEILPKCRECRAYVLNSTPLK